MKYIEKVSNWTEEAGYRRGILLPFGDTDYTGIQVQLTEIAVGDRVAKHYHLHQTEIIFFLEGSCEYIIADDTVVMHPGQLLIIDPKEVHSTINRDNVTAKFLTLKVSGTIKDTIWE